MKRIKKYAAVFSVAACIIATASCKKVFDLEPETTLDKEQMYRNVYDADAAVLGLYGKLLGVAKQYVVLNELRADLMDVTIGSDDELKQINSHTVTTANSYADPRPFYSVIINCNDVIKNFNIMRAEKKFSETEYQQRYADVIALRSWLYLQVAIQYGTVPYITSPLETIDDVKDQSKFPRIALEQLLDTLINTTKAVAFKDVYPSGTSLVTQVDGYNTAKFFINKKCLLGDLYLWRSAFGKYSDDALNAATYYKQVMETYTPTNGNWDNYRVRFGDVLTNSDVAVNYWGDARIRKYNENDLVDVNYSGWRSIFARGQDNLWDGEWIWMLYFDKAFKPANPFIDLFSNIGGRYQLKPSQAAIDGWNAQVQSDNNFPYDARGKLTYKTINGQPVITKYLYNYFADGNTFIPVNMLEKPGKWFLYRAAMLHLRYSEAANRDGRRRIAYSLVNNGIQYNFDDNPGAGTSRNVTNTQQTFDKVPYDFDARNGDYPTFRASWHRNVGVRGRANVKPITIASGADSTIAIENMIIDEGGLELAYEGQRWADLLRHAIRRNDPSILANRVYQKLLKSGNPTAATVRTKLMSRDWFLPFKY
ncbi:MAG: RagB/SusD family nutrient uptake outer membrane protein [Chitinophagaceae bacterium]